MKKTITGILSAVMAAVLLTTTASGAEYSDNTAQEQETQTSGGTYCKNAITGETYYIPPTEVNAYSVDPKFFSSEDDGDETGISPTAIIGTDDRVKIPYPANSQQFKSTVRIKTTIANDPTHPYIGTGFMIGPNAVATAGHVVFGKGNGGDGWITSATVTPAYSTGSNSAPFGTAKAIAYQCGWNFAQTEDYREDWGIIILDTNIGDQTGWLEPIWQTESFNGTNVMLNGYPVEINGIGNSDMYLSSGTIGASSSHTLTSYDLDSTGGASGGPCYIIRNGTFYIIGIMRGGSTEEALTPYSDFLRLSEWLCQKYASFSESTL